VIPSEIDELAGDAFFVSISPEDLSIIDTDVVVWIDLGRTRPPPCVICRRPAMQAFQEGRDRRRRSVEWRVLTPACAVSNT
jgi:iron complex transport system substrate-binding protein